MAKGIRNLIISVAGNHLTSFGGIFLIQRFCKKLRLKWIIQNQIRCFPAYKRYHPADLILVIIFVIITGINRLSKTKVLQRNGSFQRIIGLEGFPYASTLRRFLKKAHLNIISGIERIHDQLRIKMFYVIGSRTSLLFDFDSTALTLYGKLIEGAKVGYNPGKKGKRSYHPLLCFEYHTRTFWHGILRHGDAYTSAGSAEFLKESLEKIPPYIYRIRVRADSGFFDRKFIEPLDEKGIGYVIVAKMTPTIKRNIHGLRYRKFKKDYSVAQFHYTPHAWKKAHCFIVIRRKLPKKLSEEPTLFTIERYSYQVLVTNLPMKPENVWYFYRARASIEIHIKELKEDYTLANIPTNKFIANQLYFSLLLLTYNIVLWFKRLCLPPKYQNATLETIRTDLLLLPAELVNYQHQNILKIPEAYISKQLLNHVIEKINKLNLK